MGKLSFALSWISKISFRNKNLALMSNKLLSVPKKLSDVCDVLMFSMLCEMQSSLREAKGIIVFFFNG